MDCRRLRHRVCDPAHHRRETGRHLRAPAHLRDRNRGITLASLGAALSQTGDLLVAARVLQGGFAGIMMPQVLSSVQVMFAPEERAPVLGIIGSLSALGAVGGLILGGWLVTADLLGMGWRSIFLVNVPIGRRTCRGSAPVRTEESFGASAQTRSGWGIAGWRWCLSGRLPAYRRPRCGVGMVDLGHVDNVTLVIVAFVWQQGRMLKAHKAPLLPLPLFHDRGFASGQLVQVLSSIGNGGYVLILLYYVQSALGSLHWQRGSRFCLSH